MTHIYMLKRLLDWALFLGAERGVEVAMNEIEEDYEDPLYWIDWRTL